MKSETKNIIKNITPKLIISTINKFRPSHRRWVQEEQNLRLKVELLKKAHASLNEGLPDREIAIRPGLRLRIHPDSREPYEHFCFRSPTMVAELDQFLSLTRQRTRLLDIGALHGIFSLVFSAHRKNTSVVAVDPSPLAFARLLYNINANKLWERVSATEYACSDSSGLLKMRYEWQHAVANLGNLAFSNSLEAQMITGDELCREKSFSPDTIKIDVEGYEVKVLRGLREILRAYRPLIFLEVHPEIIIKLGEDYNDVVNLFIELDYSANTVEGQPVSIENIFMVNERLVLEMGDKISI